MDENLEINLLRNAGFCLRNDADIKKGLLCLRLTLKKAMRIAIQKILGRWGVSHFTEDLLTTLTYAA